MTLLGSGLAADDTATVDGVLVQLNVKDEHTATILAPQHANGTAVITVTAPDKRSFSLDPGFTYGASAARWMPPKSQIRIPKQPGPLKCNRALRSNRK